MDIKFDPYEDASNPNSVRNLMGSVKRDIFKWAHKQIGGGYYACDADLILVSFNPDGVIAYLDYKGSGEEVTPTERIVYDEWSRIKPVFIIEGSDPLNGPFVVKRYATGGRLEIVCNCAGWHEYSHWELSVRQEYSKNHNKTQP